MKRAVIDIGSNSIRLLTCTMSDREILTSEKTIITTRLGKGVDASGKLATDRIEDTLSALETLKQKALAYGATQIYAMATSAVRDATNRGDFLRLVKDRLGIHVDVLSGEVEAEIGYFGVLKGLKSVPSRLLVIDIGGGSTELILGDQKGIINKLSLNIGAVRMTDKFFIDRDNGKALLEAYLDQTLNKLKDQFACVEDAEAVGIGGTATTFSAMALALKTYDRDRVHGYKVSEEVINALNSHLQHVDLSTRKKIPGLDPNRADIIVAGGIILEKIVTTFGYRGMKTSDFDNLEGYLYHQIKA